WKALMCYQRVLVRCYRKDFHQEQVLILESEISERVLSEMSLIPPEVGAVEVLEGLEKTRKFQSEMQQGISLRDGHTVRHCSFGSLITRFRSTQLFSTASKHTGSSTSVRCA